MKPHPSALLTQAAALAQAPVYLAALGPWNGQTVRWAASDAPVTYGGNVYAARPWTLGAVEASQDGGGDSKLTLTVAQPDLAVTALCAAADPAGVAVTLYRVFLDNLTVGETRLAGLVVDGYRPTDTEVRFTLVRGATGARERVPGRRVSRSCPWLYKGTECAYAGAEPAGESTCDHSDEACKNRSNFARFGGFLFTVPQDWGR